MVSQSANPPHAAVVNASSSQTLPRSKVTPESGGAYGHLSRMLNGWNLSLDRSLASLDSSIVHTTGEERTQVEEGLWGADRSVVFTLADVKC